MLNIKVQLIKLKNRIKYNNFIQFFNFIQILNSPFVGLKLKFYFGDIKIGTPFFLPRKWIKSKTKHGYLTAIPVKYFYIQFVSLGYKTKWSNDDFRFEWNPMISIVLFGKQFVIWIQPNINSDYCDDFYWESWLYYKNFTKGSMKERLDQLITFERGIFTIYHKESEESLDFYNFVLKKKWIKYKNEKYDAGRI